MIFCLYYVNLNAKVNVVKAKIKKLSVMSLHECKFSIE